MRRRWLLLGLVLVGLTITLTIMYGEALRELVLRPLLYELWLWELHLESVPFGLIWMLFLVIGGLSAYVVILDLLMQGRQRVSAHEKTIRLGPVQTMARRIELACQGELARWNVHRALSDIALQWIMLREGLRESEARRRFRAGEVLVELRDALDLEFPASAARRGWLWLSEHFLPTRPAQRARRLQELSQLTHIVERFAGEAYESTSSGR